MPIIQPNSIKIYYEIHGTGFPIVLIAGFGADHFAWQTVFPDFAKNHQVIVFDNRGSGASQCDDRPYTVEMMAEDTRLLCQELGISRCHIIGSSMGGAIAQVLAVKYPKLCQSIVLCNSPMHIEVRFSQFLQGLLGALQKNIAAKDACKMFLSWAYSSRFLNENNNLELLIEATLANPHPFTEIGFRNQLHALLQFNSTAWIHQIDVPCLMLTGDEDIIVAKNHVKMMHQKIESSLYYCFEGVGHLPFIEKPERFCQKVEDFIKAIK